ncbi:MAG: hypothetical protein IJW21_01865 [Clostridia bacterium]|nr:hypothetical protein [Clostridia bacterium]
MLKLLCKRGKTPITKNFVCTLKIYTKGAKPIEKNVIVVDEQGNEYEATYPKRAKGLVKNGRARFVSENKICLACPPINLEENKMMDNNILTTKEIFEQITVLQKQLTENSFQSLHGLSDSIDSIRENGKALGDDDVSSVCGVFATREAIFMKMLEFYERMYDDIVNPEKRKMDAISEMFAPLTSQIKISDMKTADKMAAFMDVSEKIQMLAEQLLLGKTEE